MVILASADTTVGFWSPSKEVLNSIKNRPSDQKLIRAIRSLKVLKSYERVPTKHKNLVRRARKSTFIFASGESYRVIADQDELFASNDTLYTTSANLTGKRFDEAWAKSVSDIWLISKSGFEEKEPSKMIKLGKTRLKKLR